MIIKVQRFKSTEDSTLGLLFVDGSFECFTLENPWLGNQRSVSCIPSGTYKIGLRQEGGFHRRYSRVFPTFHRGMIEVQDVPDRTFILLHIGNSAKDTEGCILVGQTCDKDRSFIGRSTDAYKAFYSAVISRLESGEDTTIRIEDI